MRARLTLDNMLTRNIDHTRDGFFDNRIQQTQLTSTAFWRGGTANPLLVTGSVLVAGYETDTTAGGSELGFASGNAGVSYQWTPAFTTRVTVTASQRETGQDRSGATLVKATWIYSPPPLDLAGFAYRWSFTGDLGNRSGDEVVDSPVQEYAAAFGHGLGRSVALAGGVFGASINQQLARFADTAGRTESTLTHTGSLDWSATGQNAATFVRLFGSDTRREADEDTGFRLVNLQISRTSQSDRLSSWAGNVSAQRSRTVIGASDDVAFTTTTAELSYLHLHALRIPRLAFTSELRFVNDELAQGTGYAG